MAIITIQHANCLTAKKSISHGNPLLLFLVSNPALFIVHINEVKGIMEQRTAA